MGECKHAQKYTLMYADMHALRLKCKFSEGTSQSLCPLSSCAHTHTHTFCAFWVSQEEDREPGSNVPLPTHTPFHPTLHICITNLYTYTICVCVCVCIAGVCLSEWQSGRGVLATGVTTWPPWLWDWQLWSHLIALLSQVIGSHPRGSFVRMHCGNDVN